MCASARSVLFRFAGARIYVGHGNLTPISPLRHSASPASLAPFVLFVPRQRLSALAALARGAAMASGGMQIGRQDKTIMFDVSKREIFTPGQGLATLRRKLQSNFKITQNKDTITLDRLREASLVVFAGPRERFVDRLVERRLPFSGSRLLLRLLLLHRLLLLLLKSRLEVRSVVVSGAGRNIGAAFRRGALRWLAASWTRGQEGLPRCLGALCAWVAQQAEAAEFGHVLAGPTLTTVLNETCRRRESTHTP